MEFPFFVPQFVVKTDFAQGKWNCHDENKTRKKYNYAR